MITLFPLTFGSRINLIGELIVYPFHVIYKMDAKEGNEQDGLH